MKKLLAGLLCGSLIFPQVTAAAGFEGKKGEAVVPVLPVLAPLSINPSASAFTGPTVFSTQHLAVVAAAHPEPSFMLPKGPPALPKTAAVVQQSQQAQKAEKTVSAQAQVQGAAAAEHTAGQDKVVFDGGAIAASIAGPATPITADKDSSPAKRAEARLAKRIEGESERNTALFAEVLKQKAKGGGSVRKVYAFFESTGRLKSVSQSPRGNGPSLEVSVAEDGSLSLTGTADGGLSQHNRMSRAQFKSKRHDGFGMAQFALAQVNRTKAAPAILEAETEPAASAASGGGDKEVVAARTGPVTLVHELGAAALAAAATIVTFNAFVATAGMLAVVPAMIVAYGMTKLILQALDSKRKAHEMESAVIALRSAPQEKEEEVIELTEKDIEVIADEKGPISEVKEADIIDEEHQLTEKDIEIVDGKVEAQKEEVIELTEKDKIHPLTDKDIEFVDEAPQSTPEEIRAGQQALVERRRAELEAAKQALEATPRPTPTSRAHELGALTVALAVGAAGFFAFGGWGILGGFVVGALIGDSYLKFRRASVNRAQKLLQDRSSAVEAAAASLKSAEEALAAPLPEKKAEEPAPAASAASGSVDKDVVATETTPVVEKTVPPGTQLELPFPVEEQPAKTVETPEISAASSARPPTPRSWMSLPAEAREWSPARLVMEKKAAQKRVRKLAEDAQLVGIAVNLDDPSAHWAFTFHSKSKNLTFTVRPKSIVSKKLSKKARSVPLWESRVAALEGLEAAYARLKAERKWFKPARVELVPARGGDASWKFIDARGREVFVGGTPTAKAPVDFVAVTGVVGKVSSVAALPKDAQMEPVALLAAKAAAQKRVRAQSADAKLVGVSIRLDDERAHWSFDFESRVDSRTYKAYSKRTDSSKGVKPLPPIWDSKLSEASFTKAYTALKRAQPGFKPVAARLAGVWNSAPVWVFTDARGKELKAGS